MTASGRRRAPGRAGIWLAIAVALLLAVSGTALAVTRHQPALPPQPSSAFCRSAPTTHVHHPSRLTVLAPCVEVVGTVGSSRINGAYHDKQVQLTVDDDFRRFLPPANNGRLMADVIATDLNAVAVPPSGTRATFYGAWVVNRATKAVELHPAWRIEPAGSAASAATTARTRPAAQADGTLRMAVAVQPTVAVGERLVVRVAASREAADRAVPASQVRVFLEITTDGGVGVRWKATVTNTLGQASARLLALTVPGRHYRLTAYGIVDGQTVPATAEFTVTPR